MVFGFEPLSAGGGYLGLSGSTIKKPSLLRSIIAAPKLVYLSLLDMIVLLEAQDFGEGGEDDDES